MTEVTREDVMAALRTVSRWGVVDVIEGTDAVNRG